MLFCLTIKDQIPLEQAWNSMENEAIDVLYGTEEEGQTQLFIHLNSIKDLPPFEWILSCDPYTLPPTDWEAQWEAHGMDFRDGHIHVSLAEYGKEWQTLALKPGPGFGDLSHPTTKLALHLMGNVALQNVSVIDIGCGSGILSLAAAAMGSPHVIGIDIDEEALTHSQENAKINHLEKKCQFLLPENFKLKNKNERELLIVMNMISSEQQVAWDSLPELHHLKAKIITSGIRVEERQSYLELVSKWGWHLQEVIQEEDWLGFCFRPNN
jgi:ribosomal protein L11 methyltransferase